MKISTPLLPAILAMAHPMVLSNITVPLLGLVDTAVVGHLSDSVYLAGVALGSSVITFLFWIVSFLRMSTTGSVAQAIGRKSYHEAIRTWQHSVLLALLIAMILILFQKPLWLLVVLLAAPEPDIANQALTYFQIRIWGAPAALINLATLGCLLGMRQAKAPMWILICSNLINIGGDLIFVWGFGWTVAGVATASLIADLFSAVAGIWILNRLWRGHHIRLWQQVHSQTTSALSGFMKLLSLNRDIFLRSLALQLCFTFMTFQGTRLGQDILAANMVLLNFLLLVSFALDGFAYAVEALAGESLGAGDQQQFEQLISTTLIISFATSLVFCLGFALSGDMLILLLTDIDSVRHTANDYIGWLIILPAIAVWSYIFDGIYIGATQARVMRNAMLICSFLVFFPTWWLFRGLQNHALWLAMTALMIARGLSLGWHYRRFHHLWFQKSDSLPKQHSPPSFKS